MWVYLLVGVLVRWMVVHKEGLPEAGFRFVVRVRWNCKSECGNEIDLAVWFVLTNFVGNIN